MNNVENFLPLKDTEENNYVRLEGYKVLELVAMILYERYIF